MNRKTIVVAGLVALMVGVVSSIAETEQINPIKVSTPVLNVYGTTLGSTISAPLTVSGAQTNTSTLDVTGTFTASGLVKSYAYAADVGPSATYVYMTQSGSISANGKTTSTNTFSPVFIETPVVIWRYTTEGIPATNATTVASNTFTIGAIQTNGEFIARGRIK